jgi:hypothetical protein
VASGIRRDEFSPNSYKHEAAPFPLSGEIMANIYFFRDIYGNTLEDVDWFYTDLPPRRERVYTLSADSRGGGLQNNDIFFQQEFGPEMPMLAATGTTVRLRNDTSETRRVYFMIGVNQANFLVGATGGRVGHYNLRFVSEVPVVPPG